MLRLYYSLVMFICCCAAMLNTRHSMFDSVEFAIKRDEFALHYQPKIDLQSKQTVGLSALIRWYHPQHGMLYPEAFFDALQHPITGTKIDKWVIEKALQNITTWLNAGLNIKVSVNISTHYLVQDVFVNQLNNWVLEYPSGSLKMLELEVFAQDSDTDLEDVSYALHYCKELGMTIAIKDAQARAPHYSARLPFDTLKINRSVVQDMLVNQENCAAIERLIHSNQQIDCKVIAEGIETAEQLERLIDMGCVYGQGYSIAYPMEFDDVYPWILEQSAEERLNCNELS